LVRRAAVTYSGFLLSAIIVNFVDEPSNPDVRDDRHNPMVVR